MLTGTTQSCDGLMLRPECGSWGRSLVGPLSFLRVYAASVWFTAKQTLNTDKKLFLLFAFFYKCENPLWISFG